MKERILSAIERYLARKVSTTPNPNTRAGEQNGESPRYPAARNYLR